MPVVSLNIWPLSYAPSVVLRLYTDLVAHSSSMSSYLLSVNAAF